MKKIIGRLVRRVLRSFGYFKIDYGFSCGRHWIEIDGYTVAQFSGVDCWLRDEDVHRFGYVCLDRGKYWEAPTDAEKQKEAWVCGIIGSQRRDQVIKGNQDGSISNPGCCSCNPDKEK